MRAVNRPHPPAPPTAFPQPPPPPPPSIASNPMTLLNTRWTCTLYLKWIQRLRPTRTYVGLSLNSLYFFILTPHVSLCPQTVRCVAYVRGVWNVWKWFCVIQKEAILHFSIHAGQNRFLSFHPMVRPCIQEGLQYYIIIRPGKFNRKKEPTRALLNPRCVRF